MEKENTAISEINGDENGDENVILMALAKELDITAKKISEKTGGYNIEKF